MQANANGVQIISLFSCVSADALNNFGFSSNRDIHRQSDRVNQLYAQRNGLHGRDDGDGDGHHDENAHRDNDVCCNIP